MAVIRYSTFAGENRAIHPSKLNPAVGVTSLNQKTGRADLRPLNAPLTVATVPAGRQSIYRMGRDTPSDSQYWLSWPSVVHAVRGPNAVDNAERTYFTGDGVPKWTNSTMGLSASPFPTAARLLGVPAPATAPILVATPVAPPAGQSVPPNESLYYVYTYVTDIGEESAPSPVSSELVCQTTATVAISALAAPPSGNYGINKIRIYRTQAGSSGNADFYFLREIASTLTTTSDDRRALGAVMETTAWATPPADLKWLTVLWNGMLAAISGRSVRFCETNVPYAWPVAYDVLPPDSTPVAQATFGQNLVVLTTGAPRLVSGGSPEAMDDAPMEFAQSCVAPLSTVGIGSGVVWASPDGLCFVGSGGARVLTDGIMTRDDWQALRPETIKGCLYEGRYIATYSPSNGVRKGFIWDPANSAGLYFLDFGWDAAYVDDLQDALYLLDGTNIKKWDAGAVLQTTFRTRLERWPKPTNSFAFAQVMADSYPVAVKMDSSWMDPAEVTAMLASNPVFTAPTPTSLRYTVNAVDSLPFPLPSGFQAQAFQVEIITSYPVQSFAIAHSLDEIEAS